MSEASGAEADWSLFRKKVPQRNPNAPAPDDEFYNMKHEKRGIALILNHKCFSIKDLSPRPGTDKDRDDLYAVLTRLKFDVQVYDDLDYHDILDVLLVVSEMNHENHDCLLVTIMTHGGDNGTLYAKDRPYSAQKLWTHFSGLQCPSLAGKPKLFFIQACRGDKIDPGVKVTYDVSDAHQEERFYSIPVMADILVMYSTVDGYYSWRHPENGSYFIQALVGQLGKHYQNRDLLSILTCVNREVATDFNGPGEARSNYKEMCSIVSMLTRLLYLDE